MAARENLSRAVMARKRMPRLMAVRSQQPKQWISQNGELERAKGIEPSYAAWEAAVLPLNYARVPYPID